MSRRPRLLIAGVSTRAAAESAARAGVDVTALDAFADLDQHPAVRALSLPRDFGVPFTARAAAEVARRLECDAVAYLSSFENHPAAVRALATGRALWGNPPAILRRVRNPALLSAAFRRRGFPAPAVTLAGLPVTPSAGLAVIPPEARDPHRPERGGNALYRDDRNSSLTPDTPTRASWLLKPRASGGGNRIREWHPGTRLPRGAYLQELIDGTPGSVVFVAARGRAVSLGVSRQLIGEAALGASGFRYCGSMLVVANHATALRRRQPSPASSEHAERSVGDPVSAVAARASALAAAAAEEFDLVGVNCLDFVARDGVPYPVELNPRWSASMELIERVYGVSVFGAHVIACTEGELPGLEPPIARPESGTHGKAIVFARHDVRVGDTRHWLADSSVRDVPRPGELVPAGRPICTVFARGTDPAHCHRALIERAGHIYESLPAPQAILA